MGRSAANVGVVRSRLGSQRVRPLHFSDAVNPGIRGRGRARSPAPALALFREMATHASEG